MLGRRLPAVFCQVPSGRKLELLLQFLCPLCSLSLKKVHMRKVLLLILFTSSLALAQSPVTITGTINDTTGNPATSGYVEFAISPQNQQTLYKVLGTNVLAPQKGRCGINTSGSLLNTALSGPCLVWGNDNILPSNSLYQITIAPNNKVINQIQNALVSGTTPIALPNIPLMNPQPVIGTIVNGSPLSTFTVIPNRDNVWTLGNQQFRYANIYATTSTINTGTFTNVNITGLATVNNATVTNLTVTNSCTGCSSAGAHVIINNPVATQIIAQPNTTSFNPNTEQNVVWLNTADTSLNYLQSPTSPTTLAASSNVVTLAPCPKGLTARDQYVLVGGTGTPEIDKLTGAACTADATSGTITFTSTGVHAAGYTVSSPSTGLKEASEHARTLNGTIAGSTVRVAAGSVISLQGQTDIEANSQTIDFNSAEVDDYADAATYSCGLMLGNPANTNAVLKVQILNLVGLRPMVPAAGGICLNAQGSTLDWLSPISPTVSTNYWENFIQSWNDQSSLIKNINNIGSNTGTGLGKCLTTHCTVFIKGIGSGNAGILHIQHMNLSLNNLTNAIDNQNGNSLTIDDCIIQNLAQFGIRSVGSFPDNQNLTLGPCYFESTFGANPTGLGGVPIILNGGTSKIANGNCCPGALPKFANTGATRYYYWIEPLNAAASRGNLLIAGYADLTTTGTYNVIWHDIAPGGSYNVIRWQTSGAGAAPTSSSCTGTTVAACGSIATNLSEAAVCDPTTLICTFTDDISVATTAFTVPTIQWAPLIDFWPGSIVVSPASAATTSSNNGRLIMDSLILGNSTQGGLINPFGALSTAFIASKCGGNVTDWSATGISCQAVNGNLSGAFWIRPQVNGVGAQQGALSFALPPGQNLQSTDLITLKSADQQLTFAFPWLRPGWQVGDSAIGYTNAPAAGMYLRDASNIYFYLNQTPSATPDLRFNSSGLTLLSLAGVGTRCANITAAGLIQPSSGPCGSSTGATISGSPAAGNMAFFSSGTAITSGNLSGAVTTSGTGVTTLTAIYRTLPTCKGGLGDGLNTPPAGTYLESTCYNNTGGTLNITGLNCLTDNNGSTTMAATNSSGTALLTGPITCTTAYAAGTQSATVTLPNHDWVKFTFVFDGTSKQLDGPVGLSFQ